MSLQAEAAVVVMEDAHQPEGAFNRFKTGVPAAGSPITLWARTRLSMLQDDVRDFSNALFGRLSPESATYHADRYRDLADLLRLHATLLDERAAKIEERGHA